MGLAANGNGNAQGRLTIAVVLTGWIAFEQAQTVLLSRGTADAAHMITLLRKAADRQNPLAKYDLGYCYQRGMGLPVDAVQALAY